MKNDCEVIRKAILIGSPGGKETKFLPGVECDLKNMKNFLQSEYGGGFLSHEVVSLYDNTIAQIKSAINNSHCDYLFVYYSGHGYYKDHSNYISLIDGNIKDVDLLNKSYRQLIIIDACRTFLSTGLGAIPGFENEWSSYDGISSTRALFDNYIRLSPIGKIIVHATKPGLISFDTQDGGLFTNALLNAIYYSNPEFNYSPILINPLLKYVINKLEGHQVPCLYREGNMSVPFAFGVRKSNLISPKAGKKLQNNPSSAEILIGASAVGLLLYGIFSSD